MKNDVFFRAVDDVDACVLHDFITKDVKITSPEYRKKQRRLRLVRILAICLCAVITVSLLTLVGCYNTPPTVSDTTATQKSTSFTNTTPTSAASTAAATTPATTATTKKTTKKTTKNNTPVQLTAEVLDGFWDIPNKVIDFEYEEVHPDCLTDLASSVKHYDTLPVYKTNTAESTTTKRKMQAFLDQNLPFFTTIFGSKITNTEISKTASALYVTVEETSKTIFTTAFCENNRMTIGCTDTSKKAEKYGLTVNGSAISLKAGDTDQQIQSKLKDTLAYINKTFKKKYTQLKIQRHFEAQSGLSSITVYAYEAASNALPAEISKEPLADEYFELHFESAELNGTDRLPLLWLYLHKRISKAQTYYTDKGDASMLTVKQAEALLKKGHLFANVACTLCAEDAAAPIGKYDRVTVEYIHGENGWIIPFYIFYTNLKTKNGETSCVKANVPAVAIDGLESFFKTSTADHHPELAKDAFSTSRMWYKGSKSIIKVAIKRNVTKTTDIYKKVIEQYDKENFVPITLDDTQVVTIKPKGTVKNASVNVSSIDRKGNWQMLLLAIKTLIDKENNTVKVYCRASENENTPYSYWVYVDTGDPKYIYRYYFRVQASK